MPSAIRRNSYRYAGFTGIIAAGTTGELFQFRNPSTTKLCIVKRINISAAVSTTFFAAGVPVQLDLVKSTAFSVLGTGGTAIDPVAMLKTRTGMESAAVTPKIATTAALGAGTKTLETLSLASVAAPGPITASLSGIILPSTELFRADEGGGDNPLEFGANEGFSIRAAAVPATGTWTLAINVSWDEVVNL